MEQKKQKRNIEGIIPYQFKKGQSGNPEGKIPGTRNRETILNEFLDLVDKETDMTKYEMIVAKFINKAVDGDIKAAIYLLDKVTGKTPENINLNENLPDDRKKELDEALRKIRGNRKLDK